MHLLTKPMQIGIQVLFEVIAMPPRPSGGCLMAFCTWKVRTLPNGYSNMSIANIFCKFSKSKIELIRKDFSDHSRWDCSSVTVGVRTKFHYVSTDCIPKLIIYSSARLCVLGPPLYWKNVLILWHVLSQNYSVCHFLVVLFQTRLRKQPLLHWWRRHVFLSMISRKTTCL